jgi:Major Facilitator Superfamily
MLVGRLLMGLGAGSAVVILHRMKAAWFLYRELALAFSIQILLGRLGSATCFLLLGRLVGIIGLRGSLWLGFLLNLFSGACAVALAYLDQRSSAMANTSPTSGNLSVVWRFIRNMDAMYWNLVAVVFFFNGSISTLVANGPNFLAVSLRSFAVGRTAIEICSNFMLSQRCI